MGKMLRQRRVAVPSVWVWDDAVKERKANKRNELRVTMDGLPVSGRRVAWDETGSGQPRKKKLRD
jgi:hypothetical protein